MSYDKVIQAKKLIIGTKQAVKTIRLNKAHEVFIAQDAEERVTTPVIEEAARQGVPLSYVDSRDELGKACGIQVAASVVVITD
ncbi:ribosomal L7Ae/L30e/S12e/Gadd45 family protein [Sporosarcina jeotgali]|uniref:Ribosomal L7Ae/L30e/S12e/Gadd45 family protein n=1 Tax=Sporosarcina jeotgali TaxID=3020056 RepID=A0ABZ0KWZ7_9BACL|nr:ribosomal L7Ae/L30e/S12e/Gadd45 family protein [Sporosarcina sp. B2O-1]WOV84118.1 ribosomal L7Ae/L30e/S12e/Gadd45 family protein [Sporosarcina sp. B2O-1]